MTRPVRARIDLRALQHNFNRVRSSAPDSRVMAIIKSNAYGHGLIGVARTLEHADAFGVACLEEAVSLREAGFDRRIVLIEGLFSAEEAGLVSGYALDLVIHHSSQLEMLERCRLVRPLDIWIKIDTGMNRLGFRPAELPGVVERLARLEHVARVRFMSHLACADDPASPYTHQQTACFRQTLNGFEGECSLANSAAILGWPDTRLDWVRPGIMLYGASPLLGKSARDLDLRPAMTLSTRLIAVTEHARGDAVGYGGDWICPERMNIGVAAIGYGDGYPRHAPSGTPVLVNGERAALIGRVSMEMICIDLRSQPGAAVGDEVTLWGEGLPVDEVAGTAGTISYELLCSVSNRVRFEYME